MTERKDERDYYAILGVQPEATVDAIKEGFRAFARRFHPDRFAGDPERMSQATRIYQRGTEAYRVLTNLDQRRQYDAQRMDPEVARRSVRPSAAPGRVDSIAPRARPFAARAEQALQNGDLKQARLNYQIALQHDPTSESLQKKLADIEAQLKLR